MDRVGIYHYDSHTLQHQHLDQKPTKDTTQTSFSTSSLILQLLEETYSMHSP